jgi:hypothetical protein
MGFLKDLKTMNQLGREAQKDWDPAAQMREATARLDQLSSNAALINSGAQASAVVIAVRETGTVVGNMPMLEVDVTVMPVGRVPFVATGTLIGHGRLGMAQQGATIDVRYDPSAPSRVSFC